GEVKGRPELAQVVLDGSAGEHPPLPRAKRERGFRRQAFGVLDVLPLIQDDRAKIRGFPKLAVAAKKRIGRHEEVGARARFFLAVGAREAVKPDHAQTRKEPAGLVEPVEDEARRADDEDRTSSASSLDISVGVGDVALAEEVGERHERLSKAHLVGQDSAESPTGQVMEPAHGVELIRTKEISNARIEVGDLERGIVLERRHESPNPFAPRDLPRGTLVEKLADGSERQTHRAAAIVALIDRRARGQIAELLERIVTEPQHGSVAKLAEAVRIVPHR